MTLSETAPILNKAVLLPKRLADVKTLAYYLDCGKNNARVIGLAAGAAVSIGRRTMYDLRKVDHYIDTHSELPTTETEKRYE